MASHRSQYVFTVAIWAIASLLGSATFCQAQFPGGSRMGGFADRIFQGKNSINLNEVDPRMRGMIHRIAERAGIKGDVITKDQLTQAFGQMRGQRGGMSRGSRGPGSRSGIDSSAMVEGYFQRIDRNGDGMLNSDEMPSSLQDEKSKWDENKDGAISVKEFSAFAKAVQQKRSEDRSRSGETKAEPGVEVARVESSPALTEDILKGLDKKPVVYRTGELPPGLPAWFTRMDADGDGQVALYEWKDQGGSLDDLSKWDRNDDAFITIDEAMAQSSQSSSERSNPSPRSSVSRFRTRFKTV